LTGVYGVGCMLSRARQAASSARPRLVPRESVAGCNPADRHLRLPATILHYIAGVVRSGING
jgi:hypothetical protein